MAYKDSFYYDELDYDSYHESLDYDSEDEHLPTFGDLLSCGFSVSKQISFQLLCLLCVNFAYRLIRQSSEWIIITGFIVQQSSSLFYRPPRVHKALVFFFARISLDMHFLHDRQRLRSYSRLHLLWLSKALGDCETEATRFPGCGLSDCADICLVSENKDHWLRNLQWNHFSELLEFSSNHWQHVRGSALIISMKAISLAFDISSTKIPNLPPAYEFSGFMLCPANIVLGPFTTFSSYKNCHRNKKVTLKLLMQIIINSLLSIVFIILSSCFLNYLISDHLSYVVTYRDALIFRCSHYFISFMSTATLLVSGIDCEMTSDAFGYQVTKPYDIELPRSLIPVVISWNIPIHLWIKTCKVFVTTQFKLKLKVFFSLQTFFITWSRSVSSTPSS